MKLIVETVNEAGEPWLTYFASEELSEHPRAMGYSKVAALKPEEASARYFMNRRDGLQPPLSVGLLRALV